MVDLRDRFEYVGFWRRLGVALLDLLILSPIALFGAWLDNFDRSIRWGTVLPYLGGSLVFWGIPTLFCVVKWGGTPGKLLLKMRIVDQQAQFLDIGRAIRRDAQNYAFLVSECVLLFLFIQQRDPNLVHSSKDEIYAAYFAYLGD